MITLEKILTELKPESLNEIVGGWKKKHHSRRRHHTSHKTTHKTTGCNTTQVWWPPIA